jgi:hypothetical protein
VIRCDGETVIFEAHQPADLPFLDALEGNQPRCGCLDIYRRLVRGLPPDFAPQKNRLLAPTIRLLYGIAETARFFLAGHHLRTVVVPIYEQKWFCLVSLRKDRVDTVATYVPGSWLVADPRHFGADLATSLSGSDPRCRVCGLPPNLSATKMAHHLRTSVHARRVGEIVIQLRTIAYPHFAPEETAT